MARTWDKAKVLASLPNEPMSNPRRMMDGRGYIRIMAIDGSFCIIPAIMVILMWPRCGLPKGLTSKPKKRQIDAAA